ncbi:hypothetical protein L596_004377 [Steinernema carpocapsae]|uniref:Uncharacterized protein n=1 Tax=Steinernema carpocapsae TaxID=34508 RepID=A0A4U8UVQ3_STECR|nr:hypothetical protein L596_004377 [Steinernema carpocapsae]
MTAAIDWAKPFIREPDEERFSDFVNLFAENDWELNEFARQMLEVITEAKGNCTDLRRRMECAGDNKVGLVEMKLYSYLQMRVAQIAGDLRAERELYAIYTIRYSQYFGSLDIPATRPAAVVYRERRFFREIRCTHPPPLEQPPPCPVDEGKSDATTPHNGTPVAESEIESRSLVCGAAFQEAANDVITDLIGQVLPESPSERRPRIKNPSKRSSLLRSSSVDAHEFLPSNEMHDQDVEVVNHRHVIAEHPPEVQKVEEILVGCSAFARSSTAEQVVLEAKQSSELIEDAEELVQKFEIVSEEDVFKVPDLRRTHEVEQVSLHDLVTVQHILEEASSLNATPLDEKMARQQMQQDLFETPKEPRDHFQFNEETTETAQVEMDTLDDVTVSPYSHSESNSLSEVLYEVPHEEALKRNAHLDIESRGEEVVENGVNVGGSTAIMSAKENYLPEKSDENVFDGSARINETVVVPEEAHFASSEPEDFADFRADWPTEGDAAETVTVSSVFSKESSVETVIEASFYVPPAECAAVEQANDIATPKEAEYEQQNISVHALEKTPEIAEYKLSFAAPRAAPEELIYCHPPIRSPINLISRKPFSTANLSYQTCSTTIIPCPDEESRLMTESSDVRTDPEHTVDVDEEFEEIGDDEFERAEQEVIYDNSFVPQENTYDDLPTSASSPLAGSSGDATMRAEAPPSPPGPRSVSPMLTLGRQRQMELGVTLHEEDEIAYEEQEYKKHKRFQEVYSPPEIPEISIDLVDTSPESGGGHLYEDDEHIYEEIDDYASVSSNKQNADVVYSEPPVTELPAENGTITENHYEEPSVSTLPQRPLREHEYAMPEVVEEKREEHEYSKLPYAVCGHQADRLEKINHIPSELSYSTSSLPHTTNSYAEVYYRNIYEDLEVPQSDGPDLRREEPSKERFPYYVESDYTTHAIRRMSRYNSWSQVTAPIGNNLCSAKSMEYITRDRYEPQTNVYHTEPAKSHSSSTLPRGFRQTVEIVKPAEPKRAIYMPKPVSRVTSPAEQIVPSQPQNTASWLASEPTGHHHAEATRPPPLDLSQSHRRVTAPASPHFSVASCCFPTAVILLSAL